MRNLSIIAGSIDRGPQLPEGMWFNYGAPPPTQTSRLRETLLGDTEKLIGWPKRERVGLLFERDVSPLEYLENLLAERNIPSPDDLRLICEIPSEMLTCRSIGHLLKINLNALVRLDSFADQDTVLRHALILGLCGPNFYDPNKSVIWTNGRLSRTLDLFEPGRFYAAN